MSRISAKWTSIPVMVLVALPLQAHLGDRVIPIFEITDEQLELIDFEDGIIDEWEGFGEPSLTALDFTGFSPYEDDLVPDPGDLDFRIWLGWNRTHNRLYGSIQAADDSYLEGREALILYIDGDHSGGKYHYFTDPQMNQQQAQSYGISVGSVGSLEPDGPNIQLFQLSDQMECMWCNYSPYAGIGGGSLGKTRHSGSSNSMLPLSMRLSGIIRTQASYQHWIPERQSGFLSMYPITIATRR